MDPATKRDKCHWRQSGTYLPFSEIEEGPSAVSTAFQFASCTSMSGSKVVLDARAAANLACSAWLRSHSGLPKNAVYEAAAPYRAMGRYKFGNARMEGAKHAVGAPAVLVGKGAREPFEGT